MHALLTQHFIHMTVTCPRQADNNYNADQSLQRPIKTVTLQVVLSSLSNAVTRVSLSTMVLRRRSSSRLLSQLLLLAALVLQSARGDTCPSDGCPDLREQHDIDLSPLRG